ncbi:MAG: hypothetical protein ABW061_22500 [Polyangiaceae bacterium]
MALRFPLRLIFVALAAAVVAAAAAFVGYVLLLPDFVQRTPTGSIEPRWLLPRVLGVTLALSSFVAQRFLASGADRGGELASSVVLGLLVGILLNLAWSVRLLLSNTSMADLVQAWSLLPLAAALGGALLGALFGRLRRR